MKTPGVYVIEQNEFANSVVGVPTAVPAFIGYTPQAEYEGESYTNVPVRITSFADFQAYFCLPDPPAPQSPAKQYNPQYYLIQQKDQPAKGDSLLIDGSYYLVLPDPNTIYYLYNSIRLFYQNGGGTAYIVSVGTYGPPSGKTTNAGDQIVNPNVQLNELLGGLQQLRNEPHPTLYICPEATLLSVADNGTLMESMLLQCSQMQTAMCIFDIIGGDAPDPDLYTQAIDTFRNNTGSIGLSYGMAYYPFIGTTIMQNTDIDYTNLFGGDLTKLAPLVNSATNPNPAVASILAGIQDPSVTLTIRQNHQALLTASEIYMQIIRKVVSIASVLPPGGAMAGVITTTDNSRGVWKSPANTSIVGAAWLPINISDVQQMDLNIDAVSGKSINVIRFFNGQGILVWGARTLDGNSQDWKYISVRRTAIFIEQSCKLAMQPYVFQPNDSTTWTAIKSMISDFLTSIWKAGGLQGARPSDAFSVACGLGTTMTSDDILRGLMNVTVQVALIRPAEFIVLSFQLKMATSE